MLICNSNTSRAATTEPTASALRGGEGCAFVLLYVHVLFCVFVYVCFMFWGSFVTFLHQFFMSCLCVRVCFMVWAYFGVFVMSCLCFIKCSQTLLRLLLVSINIIH